MAKSSEIPLDFDHLFREYFRPLTMFAIQYLDDQETAEDVVQDTFLFIFENNAKLEVDSKTLYHLVKNRCLNTLKYRKVRLKNNPEVRRRSSNNPDDPFEQIVRIELEHKYFQVLEGVHPRSALVFEMSRSRGMKNQEIAEELKISKRTVETHISLVLKVLKKKLAKYLTLLLLAGISSLFIHYVYLAARLFK